MENYSELVGYAASAGVLISFLMKKMLPLRMINIVGCSLFIVYGCMINSLPIIITNTAICLVHAYYLAKLTKENQTKDKGID